jgi:hypothetical protein
MFGGGFQSYPIAMPTGIRVLVEELLYGQTLR